MTDLQSFAIAFIVVWAGLALYLLRLHRLAAALAAHLEGRRP